MGSLRGEPFPPSDWVSCAYLVAPETSGPERRCRIDKPILPLVIHRIHSRRIRKCQSSSIPHNLPTRSHSYTTTSTYGKWNPEIHWLGADSQAGRRRGRCQGVVWRIDAPYVEGGTQCGLYVFDLRGGRLQACLRCRVGDSRFTVSAYIHSYSTLIHTISLACNPLNAASDMR